MCAKCALKQRGWKVNTMEVLEVVAVAPRKGKAGTVYPGLALTAAGGQAAYNWALAPGSTLAGTGLTLGGNTVSGTPAAAGTVTFKVEVTDSLGDKAERTISIVVDA
jgi:hypothetical protein